MSSQATTEKPSALIADDDATMRFLMQQVLEQQGFEVIECEDGSEAVREFSRREIDLVVLDVEMPAKSGYDVCTELRNTNGNDFLPIIMVTGNDDAESVNRCYEAGATDFVSKPINWAVLGYRLGYIYRTSLVQSGLKQSESMIRSLVEAIPDMIFRLTMNGDLVDVHAELDAGMTIDTACAVSVDDFRNIQNAVGEKANEVLPSVLQSNSMQTFTVSVDLGKAQDQHYEARMVPEGDCGAVAIVRDVTERVSQERRIHRIAYYDALTELPNRRLFYSRLEEQLSHCKDGCYKTVVMFLDLDRFKNINDTLGHTIGDKLLIEVGERLETCIRDRDLLSWPDDGVASHGVARIGGDEFTVVLRDLENADTAALVAERILESVALPVVVDGHHLPVTTSIGIAVFPDDGRDAETLVKCADAAMYVAKEQGKNTYRYYSKELNDRMLSRLTLEKELRDALENEQLQIHYQPQVDSESLTVVGVEALLRWVHPTRGYIPPPEIISVAEESDLISKLGHWVLRKACQQMRNWHDDGLTPFSVSVNVSGNQLYDNDFVDCLQRALDESGLSPCYLKLELTETVAMQNPSQIVPVLQSIQELGIQLALDDFGTGYSSLSYLSKLPINILKIDKSFVQDVNVDSNDEAVIKSIVSMASAMELDVVAEGVETLEQFDYLCSLGSCTIQGYLLGKPMPPDAVRLQLENPQIELAGRCSDGPVVKLINRDRFSA